MNAQLTNIDDVIAAIVDVSIRSAQATEIKIFELGNLNDLISKESAEAIRSEFVKYATPIKQITNLRKFESWTEHEEYADQNLAVKYVSPENFKIDSEILIFDSTVAIYRTSPSPFYTEINDASYARMMSNLFSNTWKLGDSLLLTSDGSTLTKQYLPISYAFNDLPIVLYPAKDDGKLEEAFQRTDSGALEKYINIIIESNIDYYKDADMILAYVWNQGNVPHSDIWKVNRNTISDDSGLLYDVRIYANLTQTTDLGVASGNSSIVLTAEEMLLRELVIAGKLSFTEASDRSRYQARFPLGYVPAEAFYYHEIS